MIDLSRFKEPTSEEDAAIRKAIAEDPDTWELPQDAKPIGRGRPMGKTKGQITLRLDLDLIAHFKATGKGWQTRINAALREAAGL